MVQQAWRTDPDLAAIGARSIPEFDGVHDVWPRGERLAAVRRAAAAYKTRFKAQGRPARLAVRALPCHPCFADAHALARGSVSRLPGGRQVGDEWEMIMAWCCNQALGNAR
jgi:hypothetical protein